MATGRRCSFAFTDLLDNPDGNSIFPAGGLGFAMPSGRAAAHAVADDALGQTTRTNRT